MPIFMDVNTLRENVLDERILPVHVHCMTQAEVHITQALVNISRD